MALNARSRFLYLSFSQSLVEGVSDTARDIVKSKDFQVMWNLQVSNSTDSKKEWKITVDDYDVGHIYVASMGGQVTGRRAGTLAEQGFTGCIIIDDPLKPEDAFSKIKRDSANRKILNTVNSRKAKSDTPIIMIIRWMKVEDKAHGTQLIQNLGTYAGVPVILVQRSTDKLTRFMDIQVPLENDFENKPDDRFVLLPINAPWVAAFTREGGNFNQAMAGVHQVALMTNSSLDATGDLFTRINAISKDMGMSQQQALDLTKIVTQAIQIGGGSAQASEAAVQQFIQAKQGGVLRGEEFNSIMENGYGLAEALAKGLGVTTGELRKMAENGELSSERVIKAIQSQSASIQETYNQFPTTISNALQKIATSWQILIGEMDQANGASATAANALSAIADNLGIIKVFFDDVGEGFNWFGNKLVELDPSTIEAIKNTLAETYETVKSLITSFAGIAETGWSAFTSVLDAVSPLFSALPKPIARKSKLKNGICLNWSLSKVQIIISMCHSGLLRIACVSMQWHIHTFHWMQIFWGFQQRACHLMGEYPFFVLGISGLLVQPSFKSCQAMSQGKLTT